MHRQVLQVLHGFHHIAETLLLAEPSQAKHIVPGSEIGDDFGAINEGRIHKDLALREEAGLHQQLLGVFRRGNDGIHPVISVEPAGIVAGEGPEDGKGLGAFDAAVFYHGAVVAHHALPAYVFTPEHIVFAAEQPEIGDSMDDGDAFFLCGFEDIRRQLAGDQTVQ